MKLKRLQITNESNINYVGFVEGDEMFSGNYDVIVTDGFTGNVALKVSRALQV